MNYKIMNSEFKKRLTQDKEFADLYWNDSVFKYSIEMIINEFLPEESLINLIFEICKSRKNILVIANNANNRMDKLIKNLRS